MTVVCDSWSLTSKEQGNPLSFLRLYSERSPCYRHTQTRTNYWLRVSAAGGPFRGASSVKEPAQEEARTQRYT